MSGRRFGEEILKMLNSVYIEYRLEYISLVEGGCLASQLTFLRCKKRDLIADKKLEMSLTNSAQIRQATLLQFQVAETRNPGKIDQQPFTDIYRPPERKSPLQMGCGGGYHLVSYGPPFI